MQSAVDLGGTESGLAVPTPEGQDGVSEGGSDSNDLMNGVVLDDLGFDFSFDDISLSLSDGLGSLISPDRKYLQSDLHADGDCNFSDLAFTSDRLHTVFKSACSEIEHIGGGYEVFGDQREDGCGVSPGEEFNLISEYLNMHSPESNGSNPGSSDELGGDVKETMCLSPNSQLSKNLVGNISEGSDNSPARSVSYTPNCRKSSILTGVVDQKSEIVVSDKFNSLKRKNVDEGILNTNSESWSNKCKKSSLVMDSDIGNSTGVMSEEEEKRKTRLMRNRESAQLSRQRKKHYVEELEDKLRNMHATIQDLNSKISYFMAENVALRQQMSSGGVGNSAVPPPPMAHPPPVIYPPHPTMVYPWMPYAPPYMVKPQGSQVPLVPIPRLKTQQTAQAQKKAEIKKVESKKAEPKKVESTVDTKKVESKSVETRKVESKSVETRKVESKSVETRKVESKSVETRKVESKSVETRKVESKSVETRKVESKKSEGPKTKKVAGVSFLGLLLFTMMFGCLVPLVNVRYREEKNSLAVGENYLKGGVIENHHRRVLMFNETEHDINCVDSTESSVHHDQKNHSPHGSEFEGLNNGSEPLVASLYVPRNDKLVRIDGNLIIHSVLASEKAMASNQKADSETGLAVHGDLASAIALPGIGMQHSHHMRALGSSSVNKDDKKSAATDGALQQWFREGLAGPMLTTGMCTEVFQFDVSSAIVPATAKQNLTQNQNQNSTHPSKGLNRRFLHPFPFQESSQNISTERAGNSSEKDGFHERHTSSTSMVVSVLFDPRESGDAEMDGVMGSKSLSRIFVVVLVDSVKYVTYSCVLPFKGPAPGFVTA